MLSLSTRIHVLYAMQVKRPGVCSRHLVLWASVGENLFLESYPSKMPSRSMDGMTMTTQQSTICSSIKVTWYRISAIAAAANAMPVRVLTGDTAIILAGRLSAVGRSIVRFLIDKMGVENRCILSRSPGRGSNTEAGVMAELSRRGASATHLCVQQCQRDQSAKLCGR